MARSGHGPRPRSLLDDRSLYLLNDLVGEFIHAMCVRSVLSRCLKDILLTLAPNGSFAARDNVGAVEL